MASNHVAAEDAKEALTSDDEGNESFELEDNEQDYLDVVMDKVYATVTSNFSQFSPDDVEPDRMEDRGFKGGVIQFAYETTQEIDNTSYYVSVPEAADANEVAAYMGKIWKKRTPNIILSVLTSNPHYRRWKDQKKVDDFKDGIREAANATEMWIVTNGLDSGITKMIGDAMKEEKKRREMLMSKMAMGIVSSQSRASLPKLTAIGVLPKTLLAYSSIIDEKQFSPVNIHSTMDKPATASSDEQELNPHHTHFIMLQDTTDVREFQSFRMKMEERFLTPVGRSKRYKRTNSFTHTTGESDPEDLPLLSTANTPMVGLLIQGGPMEIDHVAELLKRQIPVVVMRGSGLAADILSFCYLEMRERPHKDHIESYLKPELIKKLMKHFQSEFREDELSRNRCRDRILECAQNAHQGNRKFLTIVETDGVASDLKNLDKYILLALLESQSLRKGKLFQEQVLSDLKLTLDWNCCDLALSQIFRKYDWARIKIPHEMFDRALLKPGREEFVELFLQKKCIKVHKYLHHHKLLYLFNNIENEDFFLRVCLEGVLAKPSHSSYPLQKDFVHGDVCDLNRLLYKITNLKNIVSSYELSKNSVGDYVTSQNVAERRAINVLVLWAALTFKPKLTRVLWKKTENPMVMAIIVSMIWHRLARNWCRDLDTKRRLKASAIEFGKASVKLLDMSYKNSSLIAINGLDKKMTDFNDKTVIQIAHIARNKYFMAHTSCQKYLNKRWQAKIRIVSMEWGPFNIPDWLKIYLCVFLIFPMFFWISYDTRTGIEKKEDDEESDEENARYDRLLLRNISISERKKRSHLANVKRVFDYGRLNMAVPIHLQFYYLWSAPITKFWISQMFYVFYLILFSLAVISPSCGNVHMDFAVFGWTSLIWIDILRCVITKKQKYHEIRVLWTNIELFLVGVFLILFCLVRIIPQFVGTIDYMTVKLVMSLGLLYFYYRTLAVFLPISPVLGPMLINIRRMVKHDFLTWMRMFLIIMISGGITIQAVLYPNYPVTMQGIRTALSRAFFAMFLTKIDDLDGDSRCTFLYENRSLSHCRANHTSKFIFTNLANNIPDMSLKELRRCPYSSWGGYFVVIQYLVITKLVLVTLLFALFSATTSKISGKSEEIWKLQKYSLIVEFEERLRLPAPLSIISHACWLIMYPVQWIYGYLMNCFKSEGCLRGRCSKEKNKKGFSKVKNMSNKKYDEYSYWKSCVRLLGEAEEQETTENQRAQNQSKILQNLTVQMAKQKDFNGKLTEQIAQLGRNVLTCNLALETIMHLIEQQDPKNKIQSLAAAKVHVSCRQSPYPNTIIQRFPVFDKYVPWEVDFLTYDPVEYTCPLEDFPQEMHPFVDPDFLQISKDIDEMRLSKEDVQSQTQRNPLFDPLWNVSATLKVENVAVPIEVNRTSWISKEGVACQYDIDKTGLPVNPMGRTGLRGRGNLCRYGPNHSILLVVSRWKRKHGHGEDKSSDSDFIVIEGKRVLEMIVIQRPDTGEYTLPRGSDYGIKTVYSAVCQKFIKHVLEDESVVVPHQMTEGDMVKYFSEFSGKNSGMTSGVIYKDYTDDPCNTDNAWKEAEVWNFHYGQGSILDTRVKRKERKWKEASSYTKLYGNQDGIVREAVARHGAYF